MANTNSLLVSNLCHLANILTNNNDILKMYLYYLASNLTNINQLKIDPHHLANTLTNNNNKADDFTRNEVGCI